MKAIILLSVFMSIALIMMVGETIYNTYIAFYDSRLKKYTVTYRKPSESTLVSFYRAIEAHSKFEASKKLHEIKKGVYITEVER